MITGTIGNTPRKLVRCGAAGGRRRLAAIAVGLCLAGPAMAGMIDPAALDIEGRWVSASGGVTLDLSRCREGWCGVEVTNAGCGGTTLRLAVAVPASGRPRPGQFIGRFERAAGTQPYAVRADVVQQTPARQLKLVGHDGDRFEFFRRHFPLNLLLTHQGDAQCRAGPGMS